MTEPLKILLVSSEVAPLAKTGGLADVAGSLPKALAARGHDVRIAMPRYRQIKNVDYLTDLPVEMDGSLETAIIRQTTLEGDPPVRVYLVDNYKYFSRDGLYCYADDAARFNFFCKAILSMLPWLEFQPDIIHCNDWQTGPIPLFLQVKHEDNPFYRRTATIYTIHNLQYQGTFPPH
ncbi:MAG: glycogen/starch synthase, partial [Moorella sp. (in: Bacteria)]|nr:glycogen/starch synthase [Moorella sp. (in: firmicutes)]